MKTLYVIRHAKSSWDDPNLDDFDRPLNDRGKRDAPMMGKRLKDAGIQPDVLISSPARRAYSTAKRIARELDITKEEISTDQKLYHASPGTIISVLRNLSDDADRVALFGHNPGLTDFVNEMCNDSIDNIPTCGIVAIILKFTSWEEIKPRMGQRLFFDYPKKSV